MTTPERHRYLERLRDLLPYAEAGRVLPEVEALIRDRMDAEMKRGDRTEREAERLALKAFGSPESLAEDLVDAPLRVDLATRRDFTRMLAIGFALHLMLSVVLSVASSPGPVVPGLLFPIPSSPPGALFSSVLAIFLVDLGALFLLFALMGRGRSPRLLPTLPLRAGASRRRAASSLVLLGLVALVLHPFRNQIFAVRDGDRLVGFLSGGIVELLPLVDVVLVLLAVSPVITLWRGGERVAGVLADAVASLALAGVLVLAATRGEIVRFPGSAPGSQGPGPLSDLATRVFLLVFLGAALFLVVRAVLRLIRFRQLLLTR